MTKKLPARRTRAQLQAVVWPDEAAARRELKRSGVAPQGEDYELREFQPGSWQLLPRHAADGVIREQQVIDHLRKKPGSAPRGSAIVVSHAKKGSHRTGPMGSQPSRANGAAPPVETPKALPDDARPTPTPSEDQPAPAAAEPAPAGYQHDVTPLPAEGGPYELVLCATDGTLWAHDNNIVFDAITLSTKLKCRVHIRASGGESVRVIDMPLSRKGGGRGRPSNSGASKGVGKSARAADLLLRPEGATFAEIVEITEWTVSDRFVRRLARANKCEPVKLAERHWRLVRKLAN